MRQVSILRIHAVANLEATSVLQFVLSLEGIEGTLLLHYLERIDRVDVLFAISTSVNGNELNANSIVQALLIHHVGDGVLFTALDRALQQLLTLLALYNLNAIPLGGNLFLPSSNLLGLGVVVGSKHLEALSLLVIELLEVVIELTLHGIMGSNLCNGVLNGAYPTL